MSTHAKLIVFILALATITVAQQSKTVEGYIQTGNALQRAGKHQEAIQDFAAALKLEPGNFAAQYGSGVSYLFLEKWEDAVASFKAALTLKPNDPIVQLALANAYSGGGRNSEALNILNKVVTPKHVFANHALGLVYARTGNKTGAMQQYYILQNIDPHAAAELLRFIPK